jgi:hypothetical protein
MEARRTARLTPTPHHEAIHIPNELVELPNRHREKPAPPAYASYTNTVPR